MRPAPDRNGAKSSNLLVRTWRRMPKNGPRRGSSHWPPSPKRRTILIFFLKNLRKISSLTAGLEFRSFVFDLVARFQAQYGVDGVMFGRRVFLVFGAGHVGASANFDVIIGGGERFQIQTERVNGGSVLFQKHFKIREPGGHRCRHVVTTVRIHG